MLLRVGIPVVVAGVLLSIAFATLPRPAAGTAAGADSGPAIAAEHRSTLVSFADARDRLDDSGRPFVVTVIGDSTGDQPGEWVDLAFRELAESLDRPLIQHPWDILTGSYLPEISFNEDAPSAPIVVWNGSASGKTGQYSLAHFDTLVPAQPDIVIFNHGLNNVQKPKTVAPQLTALVAEIERYWPESVGYAAILENPRFDDWSAAHTAVIDNVSSWLAENQAVRPIDTHAAYLASPTPELLLLPDLLHPSPEGSALTAATVLDALRR
ncbi:Lysophospholipase L1 [Mycetocola miduiensis]|uniref:Lysophospholipase L1 n=1 Tax=Mycetocola miduiensis TaxID=995034 RepID=A0A1I5AA68_9MICO|nr:Lysophospholipase L1 [Mycetocola miduiensis]